MGRKDGGRGRVMDGMEGGEASERKKGSGADVRIWITGIPTSVQTTIPVSSSIATDPSSVWGCALSFPASYARIGARARPGHGRECSRAGRIIKREITISIERRRAGKFKIFLPESGAESFNVIFEETITAARESSRSSRIASPSFRVCRSKCEKSQRGICVYPHVLTGRPASSAPRHKLGPSTVHRPVDV